MTSVVVGFSSATACQAHVPTLWTDREFQTNLCALCLALPAHLLSMQF